MINFRFAWQGSGGNEEFFSRSPLSFTVAGTEMPPADFSLKAGGDLLIGKASQKGEYYKLLPPRSLGEGSSGIKGHFPQTLPVSGLCGLLGRRETAAFGSDIILRSLSATTHGNPGHRQRG